MTSVNGGSPVGPGFVVYERAPGQSGYDLEMALASVGAGWGPLVRSVFSLALLTEPAPVVVQVKEKWGALRVYYDGGDARFEAFVDAMELASTRICETCGARGRPRRRSWDLTLCDACDAERHPAPAREAT